MSWTQDVVGELKGLKAAGVPFELAWRRALEVHPPRGRDIGPQRPTLFDPGLPGEGELSVVEWTRLACEDAWHNRRPVLAQLAVLLEQLGDAEAPSAHVRVRGKRPMMV